MGEAQKYFAVKFPDAQQEDAIRRALDGKTGEVYSWDIAQITELYLCGNMVRRSPEGLALYADGVFRVNGAPLGMGKVSDLTLFAYALRLEKLALVCQPLEDLSPLSGLTRLRELDLSGSTVEDLSALRELPSLQTLWLDRTGVKDLSVLKDFPALRTVTVSRDMLPLRWPEDAEFSVVLTHELEKEEEAK